MARNNRPRTHDAYIGVKLPEHEAAAVRTLAAERGSSVSAEVRRALTALAAYEGVR
jgi:plasmid stability protein